MAYLRKHHGKLLDFVKRNSNVALTTIEELHTYWGIPKEPFIIISCLAPTDVPNLVFGDYIPFEVDAGCYKKSVLDDLKQLVLEGKKHVIMIYPQHFPITWNNIPGFTYIELPEFYGTYHDFFQYHQPVNILECTDETKIKTHYLCLNKRLMRPRIIISHYLDVKKLLRKGHLSFIAENDQRAYPDLVLYQQYIDELSDKYPWVCNTQIIKKESLPYKTTTRPDGSPTILDIIDKNYEGGGWLTLSKAYEEIFVDVLVESFYTLQGSNIFTEKVFKPMYHGRPFLILGAPGTLTRLRELGFKTFGNWFDESYDLPGDPMDRALKIAVEVEKICQLPIPLIRDMFKSMKDAIEHNKTRLRELSAELDKRTDEIDNWIINLLADTLHE